MSVTAIVSMVAERGMEVMLTVSLYVYSVSAAILGDISLCLEDSEDS
jgi:hypothetical protein